MAFNVVFTERVNVAQYEICKQRGREHSGRAVTEGMGATWGYCKWCNCRFRHSEPALIEHDDDLDAIEESRAVGAAGSQEDGEENGS